MRQKWYTAVAPENLSEENLGFWEEGVGAENMGEICVLQSPVACHLNLTPQMMKLSG